MKKSIVSLACSFCAVLLSGGAAVAGTPPPGAKRITVELTNTLGAARAQESVRIDWKALTAKLDLTAQNATVVDAKGNQVPSQVLYEGQTGPQGLLFQVDVPAKGKAEYFVVEGERRDYPARAFGRYVPERLDDYAWENDRIAFRIYGPALPDPLTPGIDIWVKSTDKLIVNKWYAKGDGKGGYHTNSGEGMDCFKVGATLGCGACAPLVDGKVVLGGNYATWQTLDNGPLRTTVRLTYAPFEAGGTKVALEKTISLDAGTHFNVTTNRYTGDFKKMPVAVGLVLHDTLVADTSQGDSFITVTEWASDSKDPKRDGNIFMAAIAPAKLAAMPQTADSHLALVFDVAPGQTFTYLTGAGWSQGGIADSRAWHDLTAAEAARLNSPIQVKLK